MYIVSFILSLFIYFSGGLSSGEIQGYLEKHLTSYKKIEFETLSFPKVKFREELSIDQNMPFKLSGSTAYVPVCLKDQKSSNVTHSYISVRVKLFKEVYVAKSAISRGQELKSSDFIKSVENVADVRGRIITDEFILKNYKSKFNLEEHTILTEESIEPIPVIKRGNRVTAYSIFGNVSVSFAASAREDGCLGEIIRIVSPDKKIFRAKVMDSVNVNIIQ